MEEAAEGAERNVSEWTNALNVWCGVGEGAEDAQRYLAPAMEVFYQLPFDRFTKWSPAGTPTDVAEFLVPYVEAGCSVFNLIVNGRDLQAEVEATGEIREAMLAAVA